MIWLPLFGLLLPIVVVAFTENFLPRKVRRISIGILNVVLVYLLMNVAVQLEEMYLLNALEKFDRDGNGLFTLDESSAELSEAMALVTNDTGRTFAPVTTVFYAPMYTLIIYIVLGRFSWIPKQARNSDPRQWDTDYMRRR